MFTNVYHNEIEAWAVLLRLFFAVAAPSPPFFSQINQQMRIPDENGQHSGENGQCIMRE